MTNARHDAAQARRTAARNQWDRPSARRSTPTAAAGPARTIARAALTIRTAGTTGTAHFTGTASTYEQAYDMWDIFGPYTEVVAHGAGAASLARTDLDVELNIGHDSNHRLARTTSGPSPLLLRESNTGLEVEAPTLNLEDDDVRQAVRKIEDGLFDQMSFAFRIERGTWSPDYSEYRIEQYDIHRGDVAIVGYGANPHTSVQLRSQPTWADLINPDETRQLLYLP